MTERWPTPPPHTFTPLQRAIDALEAHHGWLEASASRCCFLMGEEVGELFAAVRAHERRPDATTQAAVAEEIVDVLNYLLAIANRLELDLDAAFTAKNTLNWTRTWDD